MNQKIETRIFSMIHMGPNPESNLEQIFTAQDGGADGVFLIHHRLSPGKFSEALDNMDRLARFQYKNETEKWPVSFSVGVNYLGEDSLRSANLFKSWMSMLWSDDHSINLDSNWPQGVVKDAIGRIRKTGDSNSEFFGGIDFKYQPKPDYEELHRLLSLAGSIDGYVVTTSGEATGSPPSVEKIKMFREIMPKEKRLAVASGASVSNVSELKHAGVTDFLVASSVCTNDVLDAEKLKEFSREARQ